MLNDVLGISEIARDLNRVLAVPRDKQHVHPLASTTAGVIQAVAPDVHRRLKQPVQKWELKSQQQGRSCISWPRWEKKGLDDPEGTLALPVSVRDRFSSLLYDNQTYMTQIHPITSPDWTKEETDYLMEIALDLDLRWPVIYDRYQWSPSSPTQHTAHARDMEDLKHRFYSVCSQMSKLTGGNDGDKALSKLGSADFDPVVERQRKQRLEGRYAVDDTTQELRLREIIQRLQEHCAAMSNVKKEPFTPPASTKDLEEFCATLLEGSESNFAVDEFRRIERNLLPMSDPAALVSKGKGVTLASTLMRQNLESLFSSLLPASAGSKPQSYGSSTAQARSSVGTSGGSATGMKGEVSGDSTTPSVKQSVVVKELSDNCPRMLKMILNEASSASLPGGVIVSTNDGIEKPVPINMKEYFAQGFLPPVNSRETLEAYTHLRIDAAVLYQLTKERDQLNQVKMREG
eukprot:Blabericola_migrator_1__10881@NODE_627_length_7181_cov_106_322322_g458_i0_p2_GENE_NODE_627_length_7181_cov_106_322322_g458_i0NODE_627_length_7181_cov_106_322322_g458_i0_p2_ORF_typecomplete_len460_score70_30SANT_DAMP1_like/PF16282_5/8_7e20_NODE_627_length_7181_cov_106_322322_g458_i029444323